MSRRRSEEPRIHLKLSISATTNAQLEIYMLDKTTGKPKYGSRSKIVGRLLKTFLERVERGEVDINDWI